MTATYDHMRRVWERERCPLAEKKEKTPTDRASELLAAVLFQFVKAWLLMLIGGALARMNGWPTAIGYSTAVLIVGAVNLFQRGTMRVTTP